MLCARRERSASRFGPSRSIWPVWHRRHRSWLRLSCQGSLRRITSASTWTWPKPQRGFPPALPRGGLRGKPGGFPRQEHLDLLLPEALGGLVVHLAKEGETVAAMCLARALLLFSEQAQARFDARIYERVLQTHILELVQHSGLEGLALLCDLLEEALLAGAEGAKSRDGWPWTVVPDGLPRGHDDPLDALVDAVRDGSLRLVEAGAEIAEVAGLLQGRGRLIFRRIALYLLAEKCGASFEIAAHAALDRENFYKEGLWCEYSRLLAVVFPRLDHSEKTRILGWVEAGRPDLGRFDVDEEKRQRWAALWQAERLGVLRSHLPPEWEQRYEEIVAEFGEPKADSDLSAFASGPRSPEEESKLKRMPVEEISELLKAWQPSGEPFAPDPEGLGQALRSVVSALPDRFVGSLDLFRGVEPTYARALVAGLRDAVKDDVRVEWGPLLCYLGWIAEQPLPLPDEPESGLGQDPPNWGYPDRDPDWRMARREAVGLLSDGFGKDTVDWSLREAAWGVVDRIAGDPDPTPQDDQQSSMDPATRSINTTRGVALHAVVQYALWVCRKTEGDIRPGGFGMGHIPEVRERLERHLDPALEPSTAVRAVYGQRFPWLALLDFGWAKAKIDVIFPDDRPALRDAAWDTYLAFCPVYDKTFELLRGQYSAAVDRLPTSAGDDGGLHGSPGENLGKHLLAMVGRGKLSWADEDGLLRRFFENASAEDAEHAVMSVGVSLNDESNDIPGEVVERFRSLWDEISAFASSRQGDRVEILKTYALWFASKRFDPEWAFNQLDIVIETTGEIRFDSAVIETLAGLAGDHPERSLSALQALASRDEHGWGLLGSEDNIHAILKTCLNQETIRPDAEALVHRLGARGHLQLGDLLAN